MLLAPQSHEAARRSRATHRPPRDCAGAGRRLCSRQSSRHPARRSGQTWSFLMAISRAASGWRRALATAALATLALAPPAAAETVLKAAAALRPQDHRSRVDHGADQHPPRHDGLRHAVRARPQPASQAADGRHLDRERRQAHLDLHAARRPRVARRRARHGRGLHRLAQALVRPRRHGPEAHELRCLAGGQRTPRPSS